MERASENMQDFGFNPGKRIGFLLLLPIHPADLESRHDCELLQIVHDRLPGSILGEIVLEKFRFEFLEKLALIIAQFRQDPILGVEKYLSIRLPHSILAHPLPPVSVEL